MSNKKLKNWTKVSLSKAFQKTKEEANFFIRSSSLRFLPVFLAYGISIVFLLKLAQIILL